MQVKYLGLALGTPKQGLVGKMVAQLLEFCKPLPLRSTILILYIQVINP